MSRSLLLLSVIAGLPACAAGVPSKEEVAASLQKVTATVIAADATTISIEHAERFAAKWEWRAVHAGKAYTCNADNRMRLPDCSPVS